MRRRIALWALVGFAVACGWAMIALATAPGLGSWNQRLLWTVAEITCPVAILGKFVAIKYYVAIVTNAATYAMVGATIELFRRLLRPPDPSVQRARI